MCLLVISILCFAFAPLLAVITRVPRRLRAFLVPGLLLAAALCGALWLDSRTPVIAIVPMTQIPVLNQAVTAQTLLLSDTIELRTLPFASLPPNVLLQREEVVNKMALVNLLPGRALTRDQVSFATDAFVLSQTVPAGTIISASMLITRPFPIHMMSATVASVGIQSSVGLSGTATTSSPPIMAGLTRGSIISSEDLIGKMALINLEPNTPIESNQVSAYLTIPVLTQTIGQGAELTEANISERSIPLSALPQDAISDRRELSGTIALVNIAAGVPIARSSIASYVAVPVPKYVIATGSSLKENDFYLRKLDWRRITTDTLTTTLNISAYTARVYLASNEPITISTQLLQK